MRDFVESKRILGRFRGYPRDRKWRHRASNWRACVSLDVGLSNKNKGFHRKNEIMVTIIMLDDPISFRARRCVALLLFPFSKVLLQLLLELLVPSALPTLPTERKPSCLRYLSTSVLLKGMP